MCKRLDRINAGQEGSINVRAWSAANLARERLPESLACLACSNKQA
jgi:hypothetical protein